MFVDQKLKNLSRDMEVRSLNDKESKDFNCPSCGVPLNVLINSEAYKEDKPTQTIPRTTEALRKVLPSDTVRDLTIVEKENTFHIIPKRFLGKDKFREIMQAVNVLHGEWISQGNTSYWRLPKTE